MAATAVVKIEAMMLGAVTWSDLTPDLIATEGVRVFYGIDGNGPSDTIAGVGELQFTLRNDAGNSGGVLGYYSPIHANKRAGWTYGIRVRLVLAGTLTATVTSLTRVGAIASAVTSSPHGLSSGTFVTISGATQAGYNGTFAVTVTGASAFTYVLLSLTGFKSGLPFIFSTPTQPTTPATGTIFWSTSDEKFNGRVRAILPEPGQLLSRRVRVVCQDAMSYLMDAKVRELALRVDTMEDALIGAVLDALPEDAQPIARDIDAGVDVFPWAFDNVGGGVKAGGLLSDLSKSSYGLIFMRGNGTFVYRNRHSRVTATSVFTLTDATLTELEVPSSLDNVYNRVQTTIHPKTPDEDFATVLYAASGTPVQVNPGETREFFGDYQDPGNPTRLIGGYFGGGDPTVEYAANELPTGAGLDVTALVHVAVNAFASTAKFMITNNHVAPVYLVDTTGEPTLRILGKGIYDDGPQSFEKFDEEPYGDRLAEVDMQYQDNAFIGQSAAIYIQAQYRNLETQLSSVGFFASRDATLLTQAFQREPGDVITVSETVTGVASVQAVIHRVELEIMPRGYVTCKWGLAPASAFPQWWELGVGGKGELGETTVLSF